MHKNNSADVLISEKASFNIDVPYKLIETGEKRERKDLILYLHGFNDTIESFITTCHSLIEKTDAYHLFIQAPYPLHDRSRKKNVEEWGRSWYLYDGNQDQFISSMEHASGFIEKLVDRIKNKIKIKRFCIIGFSMGGYLAGYYTLTRSKHVDTLIVAGARIKTEVLHHDWSLVQHLQVLAIHGKQDKLVDYKPQRHEIRKFLKNGIDANFKLIDQKHIFNETVLKEAGNWLFEKGYNEITSLKQTN